MESICEEDRRWEGVGVVCSPFFRSGELVKKDELPVACLQSEWVPMKRNVGVQCDPVKEVV